MPGGNSVRINPSLLDVAEKPAILRWVDEVDAGAEDGDRVAGGIERGAVRCRVDAEGEAGDDGQSDGDQVAREVRGRAHRVRRGLARADHRDRLLAASARSPR